MTPRLMSGGGTDGCLDDDVDGAGSDDLCTGSGSSGNTTGAGVDAGADGGGVCRRGRRKGRLGRRCPDGRGTSAV